MNKKINSLVLIITVVVLILILIPASQPVLSLDVSSDGKYVITAHASKKANPNKPIGLLILWDIEKKEKTVLANNANAFSAIFIPDGHEFMWQDDQNIVHIQNVNGDEIKTFPHFQIKTHAISADKEFYISSNMQSHGQLYKGYGKDLIPIYTDGSFHSPLKLSMSQDYFLSASETCLIGSPVVDINLTINPVNPDSRKRSSYYGVTLWDRRTLKPVARFRGLCGWTTGVISPNGKWVITGGENSGENMWEMDNLFNRLRLAQIEQGIKIMGKEIYYDTSKLLPIPDKFKNKHYNLSPTVAIAFVTETEFVTLGHNADGWTSPQITRLFTVGDPWIKAYVEIGNKPAISTNYYDRNLSVSSAPKAHILVTGQAEGSGIIVYKYHPETMELERIWVAD